MTDCQTFVPPAIQGPKTRMHACGACGRTAAEHVEGLSSKARAIGDHVARTVFAKRGNHSEAHLTEPELAVFLALAAELGARSAKEGK